MAYLINYRFDLEEEIIRADLVGGNKELRAPVEWEGRIVEDANYESCFRDRIRIEEPLLSAVPHVAKVELNPDGSLPDVGPRLMSGWIVSQRLVDIAEHFEPGKHQFFPLEATVSSTGQPTPKKLYLLNVLQRVSATVTELSEVLIKTLPSGRTAIQPRSPLRKIVLQRKKIRNLHLWGGGVWDMSTETFCSNEFAEAMKDAALRGFQFFMCDEI